MLGQLLIAGLLLGTSVPPQSPSTQPAELTSPSRRPADSGKVSTRVKSARVLTAGVVAGWSAFISLTIALAAWGVLLPPLTALGVLGVASLSWDLADAIAGTPRQRTVPTPTALAMVAILTVVPVLALFTVGAVGVSNALVGGELVRWIVRKRPPLLPVVARSAGGVAAALLLALGALAAVAAVGGAVNGALLHAAILGASGPLGPKRGVEALVLFPHAVAALAWLVGGVVAMALCGANAVMQGAAVARWADGVLVAVPQAAPSEDIE